MLAASWDRKRVGPHGSAQLVCSSKSASARLYSARTRIQRCVVGRTPRNHDSHFGGEVDVIALWAAIAERPGGIGLPWRPLVNLGRTPISAPRRPIALQARRPVCPGRSRHR
jgi:hypothetical protein